MRENTYRLIYGELLTRATVNAVCILDPYTFQLTRITQELYMHIATRGLTDKRNGSGKFIIETLLTEEEFIRSILATIKIEEILSDELYTDERLENFYKMVTKFYHTYVEAENQNCGTCVHHVSGTRVMSCKYCRISAMENNYEEDRRKLRGEVLCKNRCPHGLDICCRYCHAYSTVESGCPQMCDTYKEYITNVKLDKDGKPNILFECDYMIRKEK